MRSTTSAPLAALRIARGRARGDLDRAGRLGELTEPPHDGDRGVGRLVGDPAVAGDQVAEAEHLLLADDRLEPAGVDLGDRRGGRSSSRGRWPPGARAERSERSDAGKPSGATGRYAPGGSRPLEDDHGRSPRVPPADRRQAHRRRVPGRRSPTSTRRPRRSSGRSPTVAWTTWTPRSPRPGAPSTRPTGRRTGRFRKTVLQQLVDALGRHKDDLRPHVVAEVGCPIMLTYAVQLDSSDRRHAVGHRHDRPHASGSTTSRSTSSWGCAAAGGSSAEPIGVVGAITPWNFPLHAQPVEARPGARRGQHRGAEARARHAVERHDARARSSPRRPTSRRASSTSSRRATRPQWARCSPATRAST